MQTLQSGERSPATTELAACLSWRAHGHGVRVRGDRESTRANHARGRAAAHPRAAVCILNFQDVIILKVDDASDIDSKSSSIGGTRPGYDRAACPIPISGAREAHPPLSRVAVRDSTLRAVRREGTS